MKNFRKITSIKLIVFISFLFLISCERDEFKFDSAKEDKTVGTIVIPGTTKIIEGDDLNKLIQSNGSDFVFSNNSDIVGTLKKDDIMMLGVSEKTPYGSLRKITSINESGSSTTIKTSQATLEDAIKEGNISFSQRLTIDDVQSYDLKKGVALSKSDDPLFDGVGFDLDHFVVFNDGGAEVYLDGFLRITPEITVDLDFDFFRIQKIVITTGLTKEEEFSITANFDFEDSKEVELARFTFNPIIVYGIVFVPVVTVNVGVDGEIHSELTAGVYQKRTITKTITYEAENWTIDTDKSKIINWDPPQLTANAKLEAYGGPALNIMIFGLVGPYVEATGYVSLEANIDWTNWWILKAGVKGNIGVNLGIFGDIGALEANLIDISDIVAQADGPFIAGGQISGTVKDFNTGNPLENARVSVFQGEINNRVTVEETYTDENGDYLIIVEEGQDYTVEFSKDGFLPTYNYIGNLNNDDVLIINSVLTEDLNTGTLYGTVKDAVSGNPIPGVIISVLKNDELILSSITGTDGKYNFTLPEYNNYKIQYIKDNYLTVTRFNISVSASQDNFLAVTLQIGNEYIGYGDFGGIISNAFTGEPEGGVTLNLREGLDAIGGEIIAATTSTATGSYFFSQIDAGNYTIEASKEGYITSYFSAICIGNQSTGNQNGTISPEIGDDEVRIILTWGEIPRDLDSHLTGPIDGTNRFHVFYADKVYNGINLDVDDVTSYGPETITIPALSDGLYRYSVHDYTNRGSTASYSLANSEAKVVVYFGTNLVGSFNVPNQEGTLWTVFEINDKQLIPINSMEYEYDPGNVSKSGTKHSDVHLIKTLPDKLFP